MYNNTVIKHVGMINMKKKVIGILVCMMLLALIPMAAGMTCETSQSESTGLLDKTTIRGIVLFPRLKDGGKTVTFLAVRLHYRTTNLGETRTGVLRVAHVEIPNNFNGYMGKFYIFGTFRGALD
jgi:hypothetical protein